MADPSKKSPGIESFLNSVANRSESIHNEVCVPAPFGCGGPAVIFRDALSRKEYRISGLCQKCQDSVFGSMGEDDE